MLNGNDNQLAQTSSNDWNDVFQSQLGALRNHDSIMAQSGSQTHLHNAEKKEAKAADKVAAAGGDKKDVKAAVKEVKGKADAKAAAGQ